MKKILTVVAALAICIALNLGLTNEAQAAELNPTIEMGDAELQEVRDHYRDHHHRRHRQPPPWHRHHPPPPPDYWYGRNYPSSPPPPPPPPPPGRHHRW